MAKAKAASQTTFDPRSDAVVLHYLGGEDGTPALHGIPARDLTQADICRLVYAAGVNAYDGSDKSPALPDPAEPHQGHCQALVDRLLSREVAGEHVYELAPEPADEPGAPADDTEVSA